MFLGALTCRAARGLLDWTQARLAAEANVGLSTVKNFEGGRSLPSIENIRAMQRALAEAQVDFLLGGAVRLRPDPISFGRDYLVDIHRFRLLAYRHGREIVIDISREAIDDAARLIGASLAERHARFDQQRQEFEECAEELLRPQALTIKRFVVDSQTFQDWRRRRNNPRHQDE
jgi:transcriptional regulator with XRE-family HTH domain